MRGVKNLTLKLFQHTFANGLYHIVSFIFIPLIRTGLQNPYGYGNSQIYLRNLEVKSR